MFASTGHTRGRGTCTTAAQIQWVVPGEREKKYGMTVADIVSELSPVRVAGLVSGQTWHGGGKNCRVVGAEVIGSPHLENNRLL